jgi:renalase
VTNSSASPVIIVGAGLSGLVAANSLRTHGRDVVVLDKARSPGGRLATRRMSGAGNQTALLDHGAQFFTVRSPEFAELVNDWKHRGIAREWCRGFRDGGDGYPRFCGTAGMNAIAKHLASTVPVVCDVSVHAIAGNEGRLSVTSSDGRRWESDTVLLTPPVPQSLHLCANGWLPIPETVEMDLQSITYAPCLALLVTVDGATMMKQPGGCQLSGEDDPTFSFVADNAIKGISEVGALTFHANDAVSTARFDDDPESTTAFLLHEARRFLGTATPINVEFKKWRYARPLRGHPQSHVSVEPIDGTQLLFGGDAFGDAKVEGAALSGLAAAESILLHCP